MNLFHIPVLTNIIIEYVGPDIIIKFIMENGINWGQLCKNPNAPMSFIMNNRDKIIWWALCLNPNVPMNFIINNKDKIIWWALCENRPFWSRLAAYEMNIVFDTILSL